MRYVNWSAAIAGLLVASLLWAIAPAASGAAHHGTSSKATPAVSIPKGWNSYTYGGVMILVPQSWAVRRNTNCVNTNAPGILLLGFPKVLESCPAYQYVANYVAIYATTSATTPTGAAREVNGLTVDVGMGSPSQLEWNIPSLGLQVVAASSDARRVLHTIRRSS
jgi:hypothetical protein